MLSHREVVPQDIPGICAFPRNEEELFFMFPKATFPLTEDQLRNSIERRFGSTVVLLDERVCGFANLFACEPPGACAIGNVVVAPGAREKGVGRYLIEAMIRIAVIEHRATEVRISCFNANVAGLLLYASLGFEPFAVERRVDQQGARVGLIHMRLSGETMDSHRPRTVAPQSS